MPFFLLPIRYALLTKRAFLIDFDEVLDLDLREYFRPPPFDWDFASVNNKTRVRSRALSAPPPRRHGRVPAPPTRVGAAGLAAPFAPGLPAGRTRDGCVGPAVAAAKQPCLMRLERSKPLVCAAKGLRTKPRPDGRLVPEHRQQRRAAAPGAPRPRTTQIRTAHARTHRPFAARGRLRARSEGAR